MIQLRRAGTSIPTRIWNIDRAENRFDLAAPAIFTGVPNAAAWTLTPLFEIFVHLLRDYEALHQGPSEVVGQERHRWADRVLCRTVRDSPTSRDPFKATFTLSLIQVYVYTESPCFRMLYSNNESRRLRIITVTKIDQINLSLSAHCLFLQWRNSVHETGVRLALLENEMHATEGVLGTGLLARTCSPYSKGAKTCRRCTTTLGQFTAQGSGYAGHHLCKLILKCECDYTDQVGGKYI